MELTVLARAAAKAGNVCRSFLLKTLNGEIVYSRALEFALPFHSQAHGHAPKR